MEFRAEAEAAAAQLAPPARAANPPRILRCVSDYAGDQPPGSVTLSADFLTSALATAAHPGCPQPQNDVYPAFIALAERTAVLTVICRCTVARRMSARFGVLI